MGADDPEEALAGLDEAELEAGFLLLLDVSEFMAAGPEDAVTGDDGAVPEDVDPELDDEIPPSSSSFSQIMDCTACAPPLGIMNPAAARAAF